MKSEEKRIIGISLLILAAVIVWAVVININKKVDSAQTNSAINIQDTKKSVSNTENVSNTTAQSSTSTTVVNTKHNDKGVPVLMYHSVSNDKATDKFVQIRVKTDSFSEQMKYLKDNNFTTLSMDELKDFLVNDKPIPEKSVVLTFDDGYEDNYTNVYPILKKYSFKATIFVETSNIDNDKNFLTSAQLVELQKDGIDIESETSQNVSLATLSSANQLKSLQSSKQFLEKLLNKSVDYVSYPSGSYDKNTLDDASKAQYILALSRDGRWTYKTDGYYKLSRVYIGPNHTIQNFIERLTDPNYKLSY